MTKAFERDYVCGHFFFYSLGCLCQFWRSRSFVWSCCHCLLRFRFCLFLWCKICRTWQLCHAGKSLTMSAFVFFWSGISVSRKMKCVAKQSDARPTHIAPLFLVCPHWDVCLFVPFQRKAVSHRITELPGTCWTASLAMLSISRSLTPLFLSFRCLAVFYGLFASLVFIPRVVVSVLFFHGKEPVLILPSGRHGFWNLQSTMCHSGADEKKMSHRMKSSSTGEKIEASIQ